QLGMWGNLAGRGSLGPNNPSPHPSKKAILDNNAMHFINCVPVLQKRKEADLLCFLFVSLAIKPISWRPVKSRIGFREGAGGGF
ncbi:MAG: hypothetical protein PUE61_07090, partial [Clostridiales bacterium]|nr:hypothetical protein [Clostridiales bacterium]